MFLSVAVSRADVASSKSRICGDLEKRICQNDEMRTPPEKGPGNGYPLFLATTQLEPPLANPGAISVRQSHDLPVDVRQLCHLLHFTLAGSDPAIADIEQDGLVEEHCILGHYTNVIPQGCLGDCSDVLLPN